MSVIEIAPDDDRNPYRALVGSLNNFESDAFIRVEPPFTTTEGYLDDGRGNSDGLTFDAIAGRESTLLTVDIDGGQDGNYNRGVIIHVIEELLKELGRVASPELFSEYIEANRRKDLR
jgi:hypothetical protein